MESLDPVEQNINNIAYYAMHDFLSGTDQMPSFTRPALEILDTAMCCDIEIWEAAIACGYRGDVEFDRIYLKTAELLRMNMYNTEL